MNHAKSERMNVAPGSCAATQEFGKLPALRPTDGPQRDESSFRYALRATVRGLVRGLESVGRQPVLP
jgi:hypothetical protein